MNVRHNNRHGQQSRKGKGKVKHERNESGKSALNRHQEQRQHVVQQRPITPMNDLQKDYLWNLRKCPINVATGYAGTSKSYLATRVAIEKYLLEEIKQIIIVRPAISSSQSLGYFAGDELTKMKIWIMPVLDTLNEFLGANNVDYMLKRGSILPVPLETIKGRSFKDSYIIVDEAEDLTEDEFIKCVTRLGENSTIVFAGDILQSDLKQDNGLMLAQRLSDDPDLNWGVVSFDRPSDIVRSVEVKKTILALKRLGYM